MAGGARERTAGDREDSGLMQAFLAGVGGDLFRGGTGGGGGQPGLPGPAGACRARRHDDRLGVLPPAGGCGRSVYSGRPPDPAGAGPGAADSGLAGAGRGYAPSG